MRLCSYSLPTSIGTLSREGTQEASARGPLRSLIEQKHKDPGNLYWEQFRRCSLDGKESARSRLRTRCLRPLVTSFFIAPFRIRSGQTVLARDRHVPSWSVTFPVPCIRSKPRNRKPSYTLRCICSGSWANSARGRFDFSEESAHLLCFKHNWPPSPIRSSCGLFFTNCGSKSVRVITTQLVLFCMIVIAERQRVEQYSICQRSQDKRSGTVRLHLGTDLR